ncbi:MAG: hypothetical protein RLZZ596_2313 [Pseudomonadota bacterium]
MRIDWDVPIVMDDDLTLRADIFRPDDDLPHPVLLSYGPYGKGLSFQEGYPSAWNQMVKDHPDTVLGSSNLYQNWEVADPEKWVPDGYICLRVDSRGAGRSPGQIDHHSKRETRDLYLCIEWAGQQPWSNGKVGLAGISYYATNQWRVAALKPPHLAAICVWEGYADRYRDSTHHGGILCTFVKNWQDMQVKNVQHGVGTRGPVSKVTGDLVCGPDTLDEAVLSGRRVPMWSELCQHHLDDGYYHERTPVLEDIEAPLLSCGNWGGHGLHNRGNVEGFVRSGSKHKWLEMHGGAHWAGFYTDYGVDLQKRFFDCYLKGAANGWQADQPRVQLQIRHVDRFELRHEHEWPIARTQWTPFHLHADGLKLVPQAQAQPAEVSYQPLEAGLTFSTPPLEQDTEITGPSALKLFIRSDSVDADIFAVLRVFDPQDREVVFQGALDPHTPIGQGWLRASHRKIDVRLSRPYRPYHTHDEVQPLAPGQVYELHVEIWATSIVVPQGYRVAISILGKDYEWDGPAATLSNMKNPMKGCGPFIHDEPSDRPAEVFGATVTVLTGGAYNSHLLLPIIPKA